MLGDRLETEEEKTVNLKIAQYKLSIEKSREKIVKKKKKERTQPHKSAGQNQANIESILGVLREGKDRPPRNPQVGPSQPQRQNPNIREFVSGQRAVMTSHQGGRRLEDIGTKLHKVLKEK